MSKFTSIKEWVKPLDGIKYITTKPLVWELAYLGSGMTITVPEGFTFDVSIPKPFRWLLSPHNPKFLPAACLHDWVLDCGWERTSAAAEFNRALKAYGVSSATRLLMFLGVALYKWDR